VSALAVTVRRSVLVFGFRAARWVACGALLLLLLPACGGGHAAEVDHAAPDERDFIHYDPSRAPLSFVKIESVKAAAAGSAPTFPARVGFDEDHTQRVASPIDGRVVHVAARVGDTVRAGQALVQLSSPSVGSVQADAQKASADLSLGEKAMERARRLRADGAIAEKDVAQIEGDLRKTRSDVARSRAQLQALGLSSREPAVSAAVRARVAGTVVTRDVLVGQEVRADQATPLMTISDLSTVWVLADVYEPEIGAVKAGDAVEVTVPAYPGVTFAGQVAAVGDVIDPASRTLKIRCMVSNQDHRLKPEMFATVRLRTTRTMAPLGIPMKALLTDGDKAMVIVASEGNVFRARRVQVGDEADGVVPVYSGLTVGEKIVTDGAIFLKRELDAN